MTEATVDNVTRLMRDAKYPLTLVNIDDSDFEIDIDSYGQVSVLQTRSEEAVSLVILDDFHPIRYLVSEIDVKEAVFKAGDKTIRLETIDDAMLA